MTTEHAHHAGRSEPERAVHAEFTTDVPRPVEAPVGGDDARGVEPVAALAHRELVAGEQSGQAGCPSSSPRTRRSRNADAGVEDTPEARWASFQRRSRGDAMPTTGSWRDERPWLDGSAAALLPLARVALARAEAALTRRHP